VSRAGYRLLGGRGLVLHALVLGPLRANPGRTILALLAIALGVALGVAVHLVNASALEEFELAARHLAGEADLVVRGPRAGFDESLYATLARLPQVAAANPAVEVDVPLAAVKDTLRVLGFDPLRAAQVQPALLPERPGLVLDLFAPDAILLSPAAAESLGVKSGDPLTVYVGTRAVTLKVIGLLLATPYPQHIGVMDIAAAQSHLERGGRLNRVDLKVRPGVDVESFRRELQGMLPAGVHAVTPETEAERSSAISRAYRLNLDMLALIALFTGAFLVFSSQVLALLRRRAQLALLRVLGMTRSALARRLVAEGAVVGVLGAALGVALGHVLAGYAVALVGPDLGAGYFRSADARLRSDPQALVSFFMLGVFCAVLGAAAPALQAARRPPAQGLRAGDEEEGLRTLHTTRWGVGAIVVGLLLVRLPAIDGRPLAAYAAIALILLGAVLVMPRFAAASLDRLPSPRTPAAAIAVAQLKATPRQAAISVAAIVISMSLMVSMLIMVSSFRASFDTWLGRVLPADLYLRAVRGGDTGYFTPEEQARIAATPGLDRVEFLRSQNLLLTPERPPVALIARPIAAAEADTVLPLNAPPLVPRATEPPPVWVSEVAADLYGLRQGDTVRLPIGGTLLPYTVAGVWRDYARQNGAIAIDRDLYTERTGDRLANDAALWLVKGAASDDAARAVRERLAGADTIEISSAQDIREISLRVFDRAFAVTYALEIAAVLIGLLGVSVSFSAQALARRREFGVLRHVGMTRRQIAAMLGCEGALTAALGAAVGLGVGGLVGLILIHVVNRQSFHWSMELDVPWLPLAGLAALVILAAVLTAVWSGRAAMDEDVVRAVREDW
jgi:putative ABC transport system permease protein